VLLHHLLGHGLQLGLSGPFSSKAPEPQLELIHPERLLQECAVAFDALRG